MEIKDIEKNLCSLRFKCMSLPQASWAWGEGWLVVLLFSFTEMTAFYCPKTPKTWHTHLTEENGIFATDLSETEVSLQRYSNWRLGKTLSSSGLPDCLAFGNKYPHKGWPPNSTRMYENNMDIDHSYINKNWMALTSKFSLKSLSKNDQCWKLLSTAVGRQYKNKSFWIKYVREISKL